MRWIFNMSCTVLKDINWAIIDQLGLCELRPVWREGRCKIRVPTNCDSVHIRSKHTVTDSIMHMRTPYLAFVLGTARLFDIRIKLECLKATFGCTGSPSSTGCSISPKIRWQNFGALPWVWYPTLLWVMSGSPMVSRTDVILEIWMGACSTALREQINHYLQLCNFLSKLTSDWQGCYFLPPSRFSAISLEVTYGSSLSFKYPPSHQFDTSWQKGNSQGSICRSKMTSEWRHAFPFLGRNKSLRGNAVTQTV